MPFAMTYLHSRPVSNETKSTGWHMEGNLMIDESHGNLHHTLVNTFKVPSTALSVRLLATLGLGHSWDSPLQVSGFNLEGMFKLRPDDNPDVPFNGIELCGGLYLTQIGVRLTGIGQFGLGEDPAMLMHYRYTVFGQLHLTAPGSAAPLELSFEATEEENTLRLAASLAGDLWENALGSGLDVSKRLNRPHETQAHSFF